MTSPVIADLIHALTELGRLRALTERESLSLERAIKAECVGVPRGNRWTNEQDRIALRLRAGVRAHEIATRVKRTPEAVYARVRYLEKTGRAPSMLKEGK
jgi:hypothetical protein